MFARKMIKFAGLFLMTALLIGMCTQALALTDSVEFTGEKEKLTVIRTVTPEVVREDNVATVTYELINNGDAVLRNIRVKDEIARNAEKVDELQPGEKKIVTFTGKMGNRDLISKATVSCKPGEDDKTVTWETGEIIIPRAMPNLNIKISSPVTGVNIGEAAKVLVTFTNGGNISYSNVSVTDKNKGEIFTNLSIPAGATVTEEKEFILTEKTTFKVTATLPDNTGETKTLASNELVIGVYDPQKQLILSLNLESDQETVEKTPADVRFTLTVTNNGNVKAENISISHGSVMITTIGELDAGKTKKIVRDVTISEPGIFRFTAEAKGPMGNELAFFSNDLLITITKEDPSGLPVLSEMLVEEDKEMTIFMTFLLRMFNIG